METSANISFRQQILRSAIERAPELLCSLRRQVREPNDAQDLLQDLYVRILKLKCVQIRSPRAYLFRVAANLAFEHRRQAKERPPHVALEDMPTEAQQGSGADLEEANAPETAALIAERLERLKARLNELSPKIQAAIIWHHRDGYTCDEIAAKLSVVTHRVKKYLAKGLAHCRGQSNQPRRSLRPPVPIYSPDPSVSLYI